MRINFDVSGLDDVKDAIKSRGEKLKNLEKALSKAGQTVKAEARALCPVDTGNLRRSIYSHRDGLECTVGTDCEYAIYVECGTHKMAAQPFLYPALENKKEEIVEIIKEEISG